MRKECRINLDAGASTGADLGGNNEAGTSWGIGRQMASFFEKRKHV
jgi:hypothetical protein